MLNALLVHLDLLLGFRVGPTLLLSFLYVTRFIILYLAASAFSIYIEIQLVLNYQPSRAYVDYPTWCNRYYLIVKIIEELVLLQQNAPGTFRTDSRGGPQVILISKWARRTRVEKKIGNLLRLLTNQYSATSEERVNDRLEKLEKHTHRTSDIAEYLASLKYAKARDHREE